LQLLSVVDIKPGMAEVGVDGYETVIMTKPDKQGLERVGV
jgi:hypothetical protein